MAHLTEGYADTNDVPALKRRAGAYRPEDDAEVERRKALDPADVPTSTRLAIGYHESAREAAEHLANTKEK